MSFSSRRENIDSRTVVSDTNNSSIVTSDVNNSDNELQPNTATTSTRPTTTFPWDSKTRKKLLANNSWSANWSTRERSSDSLLRNAHSNSLNQLQPYDSHDSVNTVSQNVYTSQSKYQTEPSERPVVTQNLPNVAGTAPGSSVSTGTNHIDSNKPSKPTFNQLHDMLPYLEQLHGILSERHSNTPTTMTAAESKLSPTQSTITKPQTNSKDVLTKTTTTSVSVGCQTHEKTVSAYHDILEALHGLQNIMSNLEPKNRITSHPEARKIIQNHLERGETYDPSEHITMGNLSLSDLTASSSVRSATSPTLDNDIETNLRRPCQTRIRQGHPSHEAPPNIPLIKISQEHGSGRSVGNPPILDRTSQRPSVTMAETNRPAGMIPTTSSTPGMTPNCNHSMRMTDNNNNPSIGMINYYPLVGLLNYNPLVSRTQSCPCIGNTQSNSFLTMTYNYPCIGMINSCPCVRMSQSNPYEITRNNNLFTGMTPNNPYLGIPQTIPCVGMTPVCDHLSAMTSCNPCFRVTQDNHSAEISQSQSLNAMNTNSNGPVEMEQNNISTGMCESRPLLGRTQSRPLLGRAQRNPSVYNTGDNCYTGNGLNNLPVKTSVSNELLNRHIQNSLMKPPPYSATVNDMIPYDIRSGARNLTAFTNTSQNPTRDFDMPSSSSSSGLFHTALMSSDIHHLIGREQNHYNHHNNHNHNQHQQHQLLQQPRSFVNYQDGDNSDSEI
ncbi:hypothetical protein Ahia01_000469400 [Argonauta hians]